VPVEVVIARDGHIVSQRILTRSGNAAMDRSVQRALDKVKASGLNPFPPGTRDDEKTFNIKFNLKSRKLTDETDLLPRLAPSHLRKRLAGCAGGGAAD